VTLRLVITALLASLWTTAKAAGVKSLAVEFSPDGAYVAAVRSAGPSLCALTLHGAIGDSSPKTLLFAESISAVRFSPDGREICIAARKVKDAVGRPAPDHPGDDLYIVRLEGGAPLRITYQGAASPSYSPSGDAIAYIGRGGVLRAIDPDGQHPRVIARRPAGKSMLRWLQDGKSFETTSVSGGWVTRYAFTPPARYPVRISPRHPISRDAVSPTLSPDGQKVAYLLLPSTQAGVQLFLRLYVQESGRSLPLAECDDPGCEDAFPGLAWSPDGTRIAVSAGSVWIVDVKTGQARRAA